MISMGIFISLADKKKNEMQGEIRVVDPSPIWVGFREDTHIKRYMSLNKAEEFIRENPNNQIRLKIKKYELDQI